MGERSFSLSRSAISGVGATPVKLNHCPNARNRIYSVDFDSDDVNGREAISPNAAKVPKYRWPKVVSVRYRPMMEVSGAARVPLHQKGKESPGESDRMSLRCFCFCAASVLLEKVEEKLGVGWEKDIYDFGQQQKRKC